MRILFSSIVVLVFGASLAAPFAAGAQEVEAPWPDNPYCAQRWAEVLVHTPAQEEVYELMTGFPSPEYQPAGIVTGIGTVQQRARRMREGPRGTVFVAVIIDEEGRPICPRITRSNALGREIDAIAVVMGLRYTPKIHAGEAVLSSFSVPVHFR